MIVVALLAVAALLAPGLAPSPAAAARARRGRQAVVAGVARAGLDIALLVLAVLAGLQLRQFSALSNGGATGIDPVLALAPALALVAGSVATLRLLPLAARATDRLAARSRGLTASLAGWRFSRMPVRQGSAALLLIMAVATGTLALAQHDSWNRSAADQAAYATGGDVRVDLLTPLAAGRAGAVTAAPGVTRSMAVAADIQASPGEVIALDSAQAAQVTRLRRDQASLPPDRLFRAIAPSGPLAGAVLTAPQPGARAGTIRLSAALGPAASAPAGSADGLAAVLGPVTVTLTILDRAGAAYQVPAGTLPVDGRPHLLVASLGGDAADYPLRVAAITATYLAPLLSAPSLTLTIGGLPLAGWIGVPSSAALTQARLQGSALDVPPASGPAHAAGQEATFTFFPGHGPVIDAFGNPGQGTAQLVLLPRAAPVAAVPAIATTAFMNANSMTVGSVIPVTMNGGEIPLRIVAQVPSFPTVTASDGALIADLGSLQEYLARRSLPALTVTQWWLATAGGGIPAGLTAGAPADAGISSASGLVTATTADPLSAAPQLALLAMAIAAALLAVTGFWVSIAADVRQRRAETALLAALGVTPRGAALQLSLEKLLLSLPAAALGVLLGAVVARLLVPAVTLTPSAGQPVPPAVTLYDLPKAISLALAIAVLPAVTAALAAVRRPDPAADLRAAESA
jgi:hypothetical protein